MTELPPNALSQHALCSLAPAIGMMAQLGATELNVKLPSNLHGNLILFHKQIEAA